jgi:hypothetical protein
MFTLSFSLKTRMLYKVVDSIFYRREVSISDANCYCIAKASKFNASPVFPVSFQCKHAFPVSLHMSIHCNLITGLHELYHDASKNRNCSIVV